MPNILYFAISFLVSLIFVVLGIRQCRSKSPVTMNTGEKPLRPEQLSDVKAWNTGHGKAFIVYGILLMATLDAFPLILSVGSADIVVTVVAFILAVALELVGLMAYHGRLERKYRIK